MAKSIRKPVAGCILLEQATLDRILARLAALERPAIGETSAGTPVVVTGEPMLMLPGFVVSSSADGTDQWVYEIALAEGGASTYSGLAKMSGPTFPGRNRAEEATKAGYVSTAVTGLRPIPNGFPVDCVWADRNGSRILLFTERNEPVCS